MVGSSLMAMGNVRGWSPRPGPPESWKRRFGEAAHEPAPSLLLTWVFLFLLRKGEVGSQLCTSTPSSSGCPTSSFSQPLLYTLMSRCRCLPWVLGPLYPLLCGLSFPHKQTRTTSLSVLTEALPSLYQMIALSVVRPQYVCVCVCGPPCHGR